MIVLKFKRFLIIGLFSLLFILNYESCMVTPRPVLRLHPLVPEPEIKWLQGKEYVKLETEESILYLAFYKQYRDYVAFDISIFNRSDEPILIQPERFYFKPLSIIVEKSRKISLDTVYAVDPEQKLLEIDKTLASRDAAYATALGYDILGSFFDVTYHLATLGKEKTEEEKQTEELQDQTRELNRLYRDVEYEKTVSKLESERSLWEFKAIRKTTLPPGFSLHGLIFFPIKYQAKEIQLNFPVGSNIYSVNFQQSSF